MQNCLRTFFLPALPPQLPSSKNKVNKYENEQIHEAEKHIYYTIITLSTRKTLVRNQTRRDEMGKQDIRCLFQLHRRDYRTCMKKTNLR